MAVSIEEIRAILQLIDASAWEEFVLETDGLKLAVRRTAADLPAQASPPAPSPLAVAPVAVSPAPPGRPAPPAPPAAVGAELPPGLVAVRAPMVGTFYRAPAPGAPPFVEVGGRVEAADTVCILEIMKLMNSIPAGVRGRVARFCVENATLVEYGQPLVLIEPEGPPGA